ncbi:MFS transporter [Novosphingobium sp. G106]|uniref:MFS transporter n=1 Tax=Novosphingobium sp. G106 TaxID=2849500 RepID=UPI001C2D4F24|nr:MFS transporter [Novosphingobium sp. G106]MBV1686692.1 MFS transporter [Novosphingobium sp. G106]
MEGKTYNRRSLFVICVLALFTAALSFSIRTGASGAIKAALFDPTVPMHSGEMIAAALGNSFLGFALSLLVISPLLDVIGAKRVILFASLCFILGPILIIASPSMGGIDAVYRLLTVGMVVCGFGWGATEASINPVTTALYPEEKTKELNILHAWWPAGIVTGGLASLLFFQQLGLSWQALIGLIMVPGAVFGAWALTQEFPKTESTTMGVPFKQMIAEPFKRPTFWIFPAIMFLTASAELAPGSWVDIALTQTVGMPGILVLVYVSAIMFVMRHFAGALEHRFSDMGLLCACTIPAALGLYGLSIASSPLTAILAATLWAFGVCFMWPTMLAASARRFPRGGPWSIGIVGFAGAMAIYLVLPEIGKIYDRAKLEKAGGETAFAALQPGPQLSQALAYAAEQSFQVIALVPIALFFIFGAVWLAERRSRANSARNVPLEAAS